MSSANGGNLDPIPASTIEVRQLVKSFNGQQVLSGIDLSVNRGDVLAIVGPSGSGKTTLLRSINLLEEPDSGTIQVGSIIIDGARPLSAQKSQIRALRQQVGFVFQSFNLFPHRTVLENIIEGPVIVKGESRAEAIARARELLAKVGLSGKEDAYPKRLSGGQQQRVAIARALAEEKRTMVIVTHEMSFARDVADRAIFMDHGVITEQGAAREVFTHPQHARTKQFLDKFLNSH